jgi:ATP-dependent Clp protease ATP-binding subunit ClpC
MKSHLKLRFPILVGQRSLVKKPLYFVRPLFARYPSVSVRLYEQAQDKLLQRIRMQLREKSLDRENLSTFLWFMFSPEKSYRRLLVNKTLGKLHLNGFFSVVAFQTNGIVFGYLPVFHHFFIGSDQANGFEGIFEEALLHIGKCIQAEKEEDPDDFVLDRYYASDKEFVDEVETEVSIHLGDIVLDPDRSGPFSALLEEAEFDGEKEIEKTGYDLFDLYPNDLLRAFYREELVERLDKLLYRGETKPLVVLGPLGVGKHSLVHETVRRYRENTTLDDYENLSKVWYFDPNRLIAGMSRVGQWQNRFEAILSYASARPVGVGETVSDKLLIDNPLAMLRIGHSAQNQMTLCDVLKPYLEKRTLQAIVLATDEEWKTVRSRDRRFADLFEVFRIPEPELVTSVRMMIQLRNLLEREHDCRIHPQALAKIFELHRNFYRHHALPGSPAKMLRQLALRNKSKVADVAEVQEEFARSVGLNPILADVNEELDAGALRRFLDARLVGQPDAVQCLEEIVHTVKARLNDPQKPLGSFLFIGPTGVGKTQAAKVLCEFLLNSEEKLLRFDMNEYLDEDSMDRLIGGGQHSEGLLTGAVRHQPFGVVLLDEIEKAHPRIHDLLLQLLDAGRLTDRMGRTVDFSNTVVIMTSNIGAREAASGIGFSKNGHADDQIYRASVEKFFRPELVNRIGRIIVFRPLQIEQMLDIAYLQIRELLGREGFVRRTTMLNVLPDAIEWVARRGFDAQMGGRALKRQIERDLTSLSATQLVRAYLDKPIIFTIKLENDRLVPEIETLSFVEPIGQEWMPALPRENQYKSHLGRLLDRVKLLREKLFAASDNAGPLLDNWSLLALRNRTDRLIEQLQHLILGLGTGFMDAYAPVLLRLSSSFSKEITRDGEEVNRDLASARFFLENAVEEVKQSYAQTLPRYNNVQAAYLDCWVEAELLETQTAALLRGDRPDEVEIRFEPVVEDLGQTEVAYLKKHYHAFLDALEAQVNDEGDQLFAEGYGLLAILQGEEGYHLFYQNHRSPLLVRVKIVDVRSGESSVFRKKVMRLYEIWQGENHKSSTLTDLRTGYGTLAAMNTAECKLLVWACSHS